MTEYLCKRHCLDNGIPITPVTQADPQLFLLNGSTLVHFGDAVRLAARRSVRRRPVLFVLDFNHFLRILNQIL